MVMTPTTLTSSVKIITGVILMGEIEATFAEINEIIGLINERKIKMTELWEKNYQTNQEVLDISMEIDELINKYYRLVMTKSYRKVV